MIKCPICGEVMPGLNNAYHYFFRSSSASELWLHMLHEHFHHDGMRTLKRCVCGYKAKRNSATDTKHTVIGGVLIRDHLGELTEEQSNEHYTLYQLGATFSDE